MAAIYAADVFCSDCADEIRESICNDLWDGSIGDCCPDGTAVSDFDSRDELDEYLRGMDERYYDSDSYPKWCDDDEESDCPQYCGSHGDCVNAEVLFDGSKAGYFFGNSLTADGADYVRDAVREDIESGCTDSVAVEVWFDYYGWIDWGMIGTCDDCGKLAVRNDYDGIAYLCSDCIEERERIDWEAIDPCISCPGESDGRCCASCPEGEHRSGECFPYPCTD